MAHLLTFEGLSTICDFADGVPLSDEYAARLAAFSGPGFGALNGGVPSHGCTIWDGAYPPLGNGSFSGLGFLGFSALHVFHERTGKPIAPETVRFDVRVTNLKLWAAGIDGHDLEVELWSGPARSYNDQGVLLKTYRFPMTHTLQGFDLVDENEIYVDCVRRLELRSDAKLFLIDDFFYEVSSADDSVCGPMPGGHTYGMPPAAPGAVAVAVAVDADEDEGDASDSAAPAAASASGVASAVASVAAAALLLRARGDDWRRRGPAAIR